MTEESVFFYSKSFEACRVIKNSFINTFNDLRAYIVTDLEINSIEFDALLLKYNFFFDEVMNNSIVLSSTNEWACDFLMPKFVPFVQNRLVLLPDEPYEKILAAVLKWKLESISDYRCAIDTVELTSNLPRGLGMEYSGDPSDVPLNEEYVKNIQLGEPWWKRGDSSVFDVDHEICKTSDHIRDLAFLEKHLYNQDTDKVINIDVIVNDRIEK